MVCSFHITKAQTWAFKLGIGTFVTHCINDQQVLITTTKKINVSITCGHNITTVKTIAIGTFAIQMGKYCELQYENNTKIRRSFKNEETINVKGYWKIEKNVQILKNYKTNFTHHLTEDFNQTYITYKPLKLRQIKEDVNTYWWTILVVINGILIITTTGLTLFIIKSYINKRKRRYRVQNILRE